MIDAVPVIMLQPVFKHNNLKALEGGGGGGGGGGNVVFHHTNIMAET